MFTVEAGISLSVTAAVFLLLMFRRGTPVEFLFLAGMIVLTLFGIITPEEALSGFSTPAVITIGALYVVAAGLQQTGVLDWVGRTLLGTAKTEGSALRRLAGALVTTSVFLLNTAVVVMMVPVVLDWCRRKQISPSRLMIPVSYLAILGGVCSLIGTSTSLIVNTKLRSDYEVRLNAIQAAKDADANPREIEKLERFAEQVKPMGLFEIGKVGLPCAIAGTIVLLVFSKWLLPNRERVYEKVSSDKREYMVEMQVLPNCTLVGKTVEEAGLRDLSGLYLMEISRADEILTPIAPTETIFAGDRLVFTGVVENIMELEKFNGLAPIDTPQQNPARNRRMAEAVISRSSPLVGSTIKQSNFREQYHAAVIAVHRNGKRLPRKIGQIVMEPGDTLLLQTTEDFVRKFRNDSNFYLVGSVREYSARDHEKAWLAGTLTLFLIVALVVANLDIVQTRFPMLGRGAFAAIAAMAVALAMVGTRCVKLSSARSALNLQVLLTIVGALALAQGIQNSKAADMIAQLMIGQIGSENKLLLLIVIYLLGMVFTELITNNAVAALLIPLAISLAEAGNFSPRPFIMAIALSASLAFLTPIGYQTNLMVMGPGGYRPSDYLRVGFPISIVVAATAITGIYWTWPI